MSFFDTRNHAHFMGRLAKEPTEFANGRLGFSIAVSNESSKAKDAEPFWPNFFVGGQPAEYMKKYCAKGDLLVICARYVEWKKDDEKRNGFDVVSISKLSTKGKAEGEDEDRPARGGGKPQPRPDKRDAQDFDIPF